MDGIQFHNYVQYFVLMFKDFRMQLVDMKMASPFVSFLWLPKWDKYFYGYPNGIQIISIVIFNIGDQMEYIQYFNSSKRNPKGFCERVLQGKQWQPHFIKSYQNCIYKQNRTNSRDRLIYDRERKRNTGYGSNTLSRFNQRSQRQQPISRK